MAIPVTPTTVNAGPAGAFTWKGLNWNTRSGGTGGPGSLGWAGGNIVRNSDGSIDFKIAGGNGCEMDSTAGGLGYGDYWIVTTNDLSTLATGVIWGGHFPFDGTDGTQEFDNQESSHWGQANVTMSPHHWSGTPASAQVNGIRTAGVATTNPFQVPAGTTGWCNLTRWRAGRVDYYIWRGLDNTGTLYWQGYSTTGVPVPKSTTKQVINLWAQSTTVPATTVHVTDFAFVPAAIADANLPDPTNPSGGTGGSGSTPIAGPSITTLGDDFTTADATKWTFGNGSTVSSVGGDGVVNLTSTAYPATGATPTGGYLFSTNTYDLTSSSIFWDVLTRSVPTATNGEVQMDLGLGINGNAIYADARLVWRAYRATTGSTTSWAAGWLPAGSTSATQPTSIGGAPADTRYLRIRASTTTIFWEYSADAVTWTQAGTLPISSFTAGITNLWAFAVTNGSGSAYQISDVNGGTPAVPSAPTGLVATRVAGTPGTVNFSWVAPTGGGAGPYSYEYGWDSGTTSWTAPALTSTALANGLTGISTSAATTFRVRAKNAAGFSTMATVNLAAVSAPSAPTGLQVARSLTDSTFATLAWTAPASTGGANIVSYVVTRDGVTSDGNGAYNGNVLSTAIPLNQSFSLLTASSYNLTVAAVNSAGITGPAASVNLPAYTASVLPKISNLSDNFDDNAFDPNLWTSVSPGVTDQGGAVSFSTPTSTPQYLFTEGDMTGQHAFFKVTPFSTAGAQTMLMMRNAASYTNYAAIYVKDNIIYSTLSSNGADAGIVAATYNPSTMVYWQIRHDATLNQLNFEYSADRLTWTRLGRSGVTAPSYINDVQVGLYVVQGVATGGSTVPTVPTSVTTAFTSSSITINWAVPNSDGGSAITGYQVSNGTTTLTVAATVQTYTFTNLAAGASYSVSVRAINAIGLGTAVTATVTVASAGVPGVPTTVTTTVPNSTTATISWAPPTATGGSAITGYVVSRDGVSSGGYGAFSTTVVPATRSYSFGSLVPGTVYNLTVAAVNAQGTGPTVTVAITTGTTALQSYGTNLGDTGTFADHFTKFTKLKWARCYTSSQVATAKAAGATHVLLSYSTTSVFPDGTLATFNTNVANARTYFSVLAAGDMATYVHEFDVPGKNLANFEAGGSGPGNGAYGWKATFKAIRTAVRADIPGVLFGPVPTAYGVGAGNADPFWLTDTDIDFFGMDCYAGINGGDPTSTFKQRASGPVATVRTHHATKQIHFPEMNTTSTGQTAANWYAQAAVDAPVLTGQPTVLFLFQDHDAIPLDDYTLYDAALTAQGL